MLLLSHSFGFITPSRFRTIVDCPKICMKHWQCFGYNERMKHWQCFSYNVRLEHWQWFVICKLGHVYK